MDWLLAFGTGVAWATMLMAMMVLVAMIIMAFQLSWLAAQIGWRQALFNYLVFMAVTIILLAGGLWYTVMTEHLVRHCAHWLMVVGGFIFGVSLWVKTLIVLKVPFPDFD